MTDDFSEPWNKDEDKSCNHYARNVFKCLLQWDREYFKRIDSDPKYVHRSMRHTGNGEWIPGPLYSVQIPVVQVKERRTEQDVVAYFPTGMNERGIVNLGAHEQSRLLVSDLERIAPMPFPPVGDPPPRFTVDSSGKEYRMTKQFKGKFRLQSFGHAHPLVFEDFDMYCPFCPGLRIKNGRELYMHCRNWDYRHFRFPTLSGALIIKHMVTKEEPTFLLCGEIWDTGFMVDRYNLDPSMFATVRRYECSAAHRGFGLYFKRRYKEAYVAWQHARLVPGLKRYFQEKKVGDCWEVVNAYLRW